jgi:hypothetical protein
MIRRKHFGLAALWCLAALFAPDAGSVRGAAAQSGGEKSQSEVDDAVIARVWEGVQAAQAKYRSGCGRISEIRSSRLLVHPLHFRGKFCASGTEKFSLEYSEPERIRLVFNRDYLNVTTGKDKRITEVLDVGSNVRRTQKYLSGKGSMTNLHKQFVITVKESSSAYSMKFVPRTPRFKQKINYVTVTLRKSDFLLSSLELDGKNGVNSLFVIDIENTNQDTGEDPYTVYRP